MKIIIGIGLLFIVSILIIGLCKMYLFEKDKELFEKRSKIRCNLFEKYDGCRHVLFDDLSDEVYMVTMDDEVFKIEYDHNNNICWKTKTTIDPNELIHRNNII